MLLPTDKELSPSAGHTQELKIKGCPNVAVEEIVHFVATANRSNLFGRDHPTFLSHTHTYSQMNWYFATRCLLIVDTLI